MNDQGYKRMNEGPRRSEAADSSLFSAELASPSSNLSFRVISQSSSSPSSIPLRTIGVVEWEIDDLNAEEVAHAVERLRSLPVIDVLTYPVFMKKGRIGTAFRVLVDPELVEELVPRFMKETGTLGVRYYTVQRFLAQRFHQQLEVEVRPSSREKEKQPSHTPDKLDRSSMEKEETRFSLRLKVSRLPEGSIRIKPEFEDLKRIAEHFDVPLWEVKQALFRLYTNE